MLELLIKSAHWCEFKHNGERIDADADERNDVRMFQMNQDVQLLSEINIRVSLQRIFTYNVWGSITLLVTSCFN